jgi:hypothetical protein
VPPTRCWRGYAPRRANAKQFAAKRAQKRAPDPSPDCHQELPPRDRKPIWFQWNCAEDNHHVLIGKEDYFGSADGLLMPGKRNQALPDLRYFKASRN